MGLWELKGGRGDLKRFKGHSVASTVASCVAVVEAGPYLTSVDIRPNTLK